MEGQIEVHLKLNLHEFAPERGKQFLYPLPYAWTVQDLIRDLHLPDEESLLVVVNGLQAGPGTMLKDGDQVKIFPVLAGG